MDEEVGIIVGTGIGGQKNIVETLTNSGFNVSRVSQMWPRDHYVYFQNRYVTSGSPGFLNGNAFGEGGNILTGDDFLLVSDMAYLHTSIAESLPDKPTYEQIKSALDAEGKKFHPNSRIHVAPTGYFHGRMGNSHIDMFSLLLPKSQILLLDTHFGKEAGNAKEYDAIAEAEGLKLIRYDGSQDKVWNPLNSLNVSRNGRDVVLIDDKAKSLGRLLRDEGVEVLETGMPQENYPAGKIRCQTNTYKIGDDFGKLLYKI